MKIIFIKEYEDTSLLSVPVLIEMGQKGEVLDEVKGTILLTDLAWPLVIVNRGSFS